MSSILLLAGMLFLRVSLIVLPLGIGLAVQTADALPVTHGLALEDHEASPNPGTLHIGGFATNDFRWLSNPVMPLGLFDSFSIVTGSLVFELVNAYGPVLEGVLADASRAPVRLPEEPPVLALLSMGVVGMAFYKRRRRKQAYDKGSEGPCVYDRD